MASGYTRRKTICPIIKSFAVKVVCRVFIFQMFTCVFKLKRPRIYVGFVMTFPENCNDCSKRWNFKLKSYQASWNKTASDIRWKATKKKPLTHSWTKLLFCRFKTKRVANYLTSRLRNLLSIGIREKTIPLKLSAVRSKNSLERKTFNGKRRKDWE